MSPSRRRRLLSRRNAAFVGIGVVVAGACLFAWARTRDTPTELRLDQFTERLDAGRVRSATVKNADSTVHGELVNGVDYVVVFPSAYGEQLTNDLLDAGVRADADNHDGSAWSDLLVGLIPTVLIIAVFIWFISEMQGGGQGSRFGRTRAKAVEPGSSGVTFADVAGADEAVEELREIVDFLSEPERFHLLGARVPRGVLLVGPPGTGKTLLARAVAGEAGVPFFSLSGSDFVEMFVGVGASRVRDLFRRAQEEAPAIVFIDEIDAVGRHRGAGVGGGHDEREQTLNQMLVQMDGFDPAGVILMAATNRPDILDPALLRPGRFDRQILVDQPDVAGRLAILDVHARNKPIDESVDLSVIARRTPGFTGADLANVLNESALLAARRSSQRIGQVDIDNAVERVVAGPERRSRVMTLNERVTVATHEAGHAMVSHALPHADDVHKISIVSRGAALGYTVMLPDEDRRLHSRAELSDRLAVALGGRAAEEVVFGEITTGAADDIERASALARAMVTEYGMSDKLGPRRFATREAEPFLGRDHHRAGEYSDELSARIDEEISRLIDEAHGRARRLLEEHRDLLDRLATALVSRETLGETELGEFLAPLTPAEFSDGLPAPDANGLQG